MERQRVYTACATAREEETPVAILGGKAIETETGNMGVCSGDLAMFGRVYDACSGEGF